MQEIRVFSSSYGQVHCPYGTPFKAKSGINPRELTLENRSHGILLRFALKLAVLENVLQSVLDLLLRCVRHG
jgi:hypothetical protein